MKGQNYKDKNRVKFLADGIWIDGTPRIILCSSVFYFRIPREEWRDRLEKVRAAGYNCVETYVPWNYHETEEAQWDFNGEKDVTAFLALVAELGLWVIARPGPYICSEWDMGSLPAYLLTKEGLVLREYNQIYLNYVKSWYDQIMPIIVDYQLGKQGTVIAVQIENELDFYDCRQVEPYIAALRDLAKEAGVEVPLIVCAGQCDIARAGGLVEGVIPTINLYPQTKERTLEDRIHHYTKIFGEKDMPLCITETSQNHFTLRRELIAGAKLIAPYNQVGGTDFGFTTAVNNWGGPLSYLPHDYNLGGMINSRGECGAEYKEAFLLGGLIHSLEYGISRGVSIPETQLNITGECRLSHGIHRTLSLAQGGKLAAIANIDEIPGKVRFEYGGQIRPSYTELMVRPVRCPILAFDLPLFALGFKEKVGTIAYSTAEIGCIKKNGNNLHIMLYTEYEGEVAFAFTQPAEIMVEGMVLHEEQELSVLSFTASHQGMAKISFQGEATVYLYAISREEAIKYLANNVFERNNLMRILKLDSLEELSDNIADILWNAKQEPVLVEEDTAILSAMQQIRYRKYPLPVMGLPIEEPSDAARVFTGDRCLPMEDMKYYRGYGWYEGNVILSTAQKKLGYMIYQGMDILHLYRNDEYIESYIGKGIHKFIKEPKLFHETQVKLGVRCEIWGHSNFSDSRIPAMDIRSKKGLQGLAVITSIEDISENWCYNKDEVPIEQTSLLSDQDNYLPRISFGSYNNPEQPQLGVYKKKVMLHPGCNSIVLEINGLKSYGKVYINGHFIGEVQPHNSTVTLDRISGQEEMELAIFLHQKTIQESTKLKLHLYEGQHVMDVHCYGAEEKQLAAYTAKVKETGKKKVQTTVLEDIKLRPGEVSLFSGSFTIQEEQKQSIRLSISGKDTKVLVMLNGFMLGRLWLSSEHARPDFFGGDDTVLYLPKSYMREENQLDLFVEAMADQPRIEKLLFEAISNR